MVLTEGTAWRSSFATSVNACPSCGAEFLAKGIDVQRPRRVPVKANTVSVCATCGQLVVSEPIHDPLGLGNRLFRLAHEGDIARVGAGQRRRLQIMRETVRSEDWAGRFKELAHAIEGRFAEEGAFHEQR